MDIPLKLTFDTEEATKVLKEKMKKLLTEQGGRKIDILFGDITKASMQELESPEFGYMSRKVDEILVGLLTDEKYAKFIERYVAENFETVLTKSLDTAMEHHANKLAFGSVKAHAPRKN